RTTRTRTNRSRSRRTTPPPCRRRPTSRPSARRRRSFRTRASRRPTKSRFTPSPAAAAATSRARRPRRSRSRARSSVWVCSRLVVRSARRDVAFAREAARRDGLAPPRQATRGSVNEPAGPAPGPWRPGRELFAAARRHPRSAKTRSPQVTSPRLIEKQAKSGSLLPVYLFVGDERLLRDRAIDAIRAAALGTGIAAFNEDK